MDTTLKKDMMCFMDKHITFRIYTETEYRSRTGISVARSMFPLEKIICTSGPVLYVTCAAYGGNYLCSVSKSVRVIVLTIR